MAESGQARGTAKIDGPPAGAAVAPVKVRGKKSPWWAKVALVFGVLLLLGSGLTFFGGALLLQHVSSTIQQQNLLGSVGAGGSKGSSITGAINILLVGLDTRDDNPGMGSRSDSIIIAHIPATHDRAT